MSDFQKQTLKRFAVKLLIVCAGVGLIYEVVTSKNIAYTVLALLVLIVLCALLWVIITALWVIIPMFCWDWKLRGLLDKDEYEAYHACERHFSYNQGKYMPTEEQISIMVKGTEIDSKTLWSMFNKMTENTNILLKVREG